MDTTGLEFDREKLKRLRDAANMTQHMLAIAAGIPQAQHIGNWECGRSAPNGRNLLGLARALGVAPAELYRTKQGE